MPLFEENNQNTNQTEGGFQTAQKSSQATESQKPSGIIATIGQLLPLAPFVFEQFTGQKVPQMTGTMADMQMTLSQISTNLQIVVNNQQQLAQRLIALETNANQHLINLTNQFNSLRLTHTKEQKRIEYGNNSSFTEESPENY